MVWPSCLSCGDQFPQTAGCLRIQTERRLIQKEDGRAGQQCLGDGDALAHPGRIFFDEFIGAVLDLHALDQFIDAFLRHRWWDVIQRREIFQVFTAAQLPVNAALACQHGAQTPPDFVRLFDDIEAIDLGRAAGGLEQGAQHADGGGFSCAVRSQQTEDFAALDLQVHAIDGGEHGSGRAFVEKRAAALWGRKAGSIGLLIVTAIRPGGEFLNQLVSFYGEIGHVILLGLFA